MEITGSCGTPLKTVFQLVTVCALLLFVSSAHSLLYLLGIMFNLISINRYFRRRMKTAGAMLLPLQFDFKFDFTFVYYNFCKK